MVLMTILECREPDKWRRQGKPAQSQHTGTTHMASNPYLNSGLDNMAHKRLPYYHPELANMDEVRFLMTHYVTQDGAFILRNSFTKSGVLTVTVMHSHSIKHFSLLQHRDKYMLQKQMFDCVKDLIDYYMIHDVPNEEKVKHLRLLHPINTRPMSLPVTHRPIPVPPGSNDRRKMGARSQSVVAPPTLPLDAASPVHRGSIDSSMWNDAAAAAAAASSPSGNATDGSTPQLPLNKPKKERRFGLGFLKKKSSSSSDTSALAMSPEDRGPLPLPKPAETEKDSHYYSIVGPDNVDRSRVLMEHIKQFEVQGDDRCECGLTFEESELPCGWTMHLSQDSNTCGLLFFMGPNKETEWKLPFDISLQLTPDQQDNIKRLMDQSKRSSSSSSGSTGVSTGRPSGSGQVTYGRQATEHECSSDEVFPSFNIG